MQTFGQDRLCCNSKRSGYCKHDCVIRQLSHSIMMKNCTRSRVDIGPRIRNFWKCFQNSWDNFVFLNWVRLGWVIWKMESIWLTFESSLHCQKNRIFWEMFFPKLHKRIESWISYSQNCMSITCLYFVFEKFWSKGSFKLEYVPGITIPWSRYSWQSFSICSSVGVPSWSCITLWIQVMHSCDASPCNGPANPQNPPQIE